MRMAPRRLFQPGWGRGEFWVFGGRGGEVDGEKEGVTYHRRLWERGEGRGLGELDRVHLDVLGLGRGFLCRLLR